MSRLDFDPKNLPADLGASTWSDVSLSIILNGIILIYIMLPGVRQAFHMDKQSG